MAGIGKGVDAFFEETEDTQDVKGQQDDKSARQHDDVQTKQAFAPDLKRATFYIRPEQDIKIEELKLELTRGGVNTNKSELVREAIDLLAEQDLQVLAKRLTNK
jgi:hypothetical protein